MWKFNSVSCNFFRYVTVKFFMIYFRLVCKKTNNFQQELSLSFSFKWYFILWWKKNKNNKKKVQRYTENVCLTKNMGQNFMVIVIHDEILTVLILCVKTVMWKVFIVLHYNLMICSVLKYVATVVQFVLSFIYLPLMLHAFRSFRFWRAAI